MKIPKSPSKEALMAGRQAKTITPVQMDTLMQHVRGRKDSARSRVIILLSLRAGLRAAEIAKLEWSMVLDATGRVGQTIELEDRIAKKKHGRRIPIHPELRHAIVTLQRGQRQIYGPVIRSRSSGAAMRPNSLVNWFKSLYLALDFGGCSSHSGRRTFITQAARLIPQAGGSLRDVQLLAGHKSLVTTERYIDGDSHAQRKLVHLL
jgi:integrase